MRNTALVFFVICLAWQTCLAVPSGILPDTLDGLLGLLKKGGKPTPVPTTPCAPGTTKAPHSSPNVTVNVNVTIVVHVNADAKPNTAPVVKSDDKGGLLNILIVVTTKINVNTESDVNSIVNIGKIVRDVVHDACDNDNTIIKIVSKIVIIIKAKSSGDHQTDLEVITIVDGGKTVDVVIENLSIELTGKLIVKSVVCVNGTAIVSIGSSSCSEVLIVIIITCRVDVTIESVANAYLNSVVVLVTRKLNGDIKLNVAAKGIIIIDINIGGRNTDCEDDSNEDKIINIEIHIGARVDGKPDVNVKGTRVTVLIKLSSDQNSECDDDDIVIKILINVGASVVGKSIININGIVVTVISDIDVNVTVRGNVVVCIIAEVNVIVKINVGCTRVIIINNPSDDCEDDSNDNKVVKIVINVEATVDVKISVIVDSSVVTFIGDVDLNVCVTGNVIVIVITKTCAEIVAEPIINININSIIVTVIVKPSDDYDCEDNSSDVKIVINVEASVDVKSNIIVRGTIVTIIGAVNIKVTVQGCLIVVIIARINDEGGTDTLVKITVDINGVVRVVGGDQSSDCEDDSTDSDADIKIVINGNINRKPIIVVAANIKIKIKVVALL